MSRNKKRIGHSIAAAHSNDFAALQRQKSCVSVQHFAPVPLFGRARSTSRYRMPPVLPSVGPEATLRTPDFRLPAIRPTFILRPFRTNLSTPKIKKVDKRMFATQPTTRSFAERRGFEPLIRFRRIRAFQARLFNHSSTSPRMGKDNDFSGNRPNFAPTNSPSGTIFSGHCRQKTLPHASEPGQTAFIPPGSRPFAVRQKAACLIAEERPARNRPYPKTNLQAQTV